MASVDPHAQHREGRIIPFYRPDVHVEVRRLGAAAIDLLILLVLQTWINDVFGVTRLTGGPPLHQAGGGYLYVTTVTTVDVSWLALLMVVFFSVQEALFGATWGKLVAGVCVVDVDGRRPTLGAVLVRNILRLVDYWPLFYVAGIIAALGSPSRQRLGDRVARTLVVRAESAVLAHRSRGEVRRRLAVLACALTLFVAFCLGFAYYGRPPLVIAGLARTYALFRGSGIGSYALGAPHWARGTVTYPIRYETLDGHTHCSGSITLRWAGFFAIGGGWVLDHSHSRCT
jgi:uncharacterized RDD family membrane protein YckC